MNQTQALEYAYKSLRGECTCPQSVFNYAMSPREVKPGTEEPWTDEEVDARFGDRPQDKFVRASTQRATADIERFEVDDMSDEEKEEMYQSMTSELAEPALANGGDPRSISKASFSRRDGMFPDHLSFATQANEATGRQHTAETLARLGSIDWSGMATQAATDNPDHFSTGSTENSQNTRSTRQGQFAAEMEIGGRIWSPAQLNQFGNYSRGMDSRPAPQRVTTERAARESWRFLDEMHNIKGYAPNEDDLAAAAHVSRHGGPWG
jgi:hypothetical protein